MKRSEKRVQMWLLAASKWLHTDDVCGPSTGQTPPGLTFWASVTSSHTQLRLTTYRLHPSMSTGSSRRSLCELCPTHSTQTLTFILYDHLLNNMAKSLFFKNLETEVRRLRRDESHFQHMLASPDGGLNQYVVFDFFQVCDTFSTFVKHVLGTLCFLRSHFEGKLRWGISFCYLISWSTF